MTFPHGRTSFRWFPKPHIHVMQYETGHEEIYPYTTYTKELAPYIRPIHLLLSLNVIPWYKEGIGMIYENAPDWLLREFASISPMPKFFSANFCAADIKFFRVPSKDEKNFTCTGLGSDWMEAIRLRQSKVAQSFVNIRSDLVYTEKGLCIREEDEERERIPEELDRRDFIREEILCFHDELVCQIKGEEYATKRFCKFCKSKKNLERI